MNLLRNFSSVIRHALSASHLLDRAMANPDLTTRLPTLSSLANAASTAGAVSASETPAARAPGPEHVILQFPVPSGGAQLASAGADASPVVYSPQGGQVAILKAGQQSASWSNPFVSHALPAVLQLRRHLADGPLNQSAVRTQLGLEVRLYRERLASSGC